MPDILSDLPIQAPLAAVFQAIATPEGLDRWWTRRATGTPILESEYELGFGSGVEWQARVTRCLPPTAFEVEITRAGADWIGTRVGFDLAHVDGVTQVRFHHIGWPHANQHYRASCYCWPMYLRILRRYLEHGESVPYERRLDV